MVIKTRAPPHNITNLRIRTAYVRYVRTIRTYMYDMVNLCLWKYEMENIYTGKTISYYYHHNHILCYCVCHQPLPQPYNYNLMPSHSQPQPPIRPGDRELCYVMFSCCRWIWIQSTEMRTRGEWGRVVCDAGICIQRTRYRITGEIWYGEYNIT